MARGNEESVGACPQCAGPLDFKLKASVQCVCPYCGALVVREGASLANFGSCADLLESSSPFRLGTSGIHQQRSFEIIGRRQIGWERGFWEEWSGGLSEVPQPGHRLTHREGQNSIVDVKTAFVRAVDGELPEAYRLGENFRSLDCIDALANLLTIEISPAGRTCYAGQYVQVEHLELRYTREECDDWR